MRALEPWVAAPLQTFITESSARLILLMTTSGQVVAQHGFSRSVEVMTAAALGAAIVASTEELARLMSTSRFAALVHGGNRQSCMLSAFGRRGDGGLAWWYSGRRHRWDWSSSFSIRW